MQPFLTLEGPERQTALDLYRQPKEALLSTHSAKFPGFPFGSLAPYVLGPQGQPVVFFSALAQHAKNLKENPLASLTLFPPGVTMEQPRLTLLVEAKGLAGDPAPVLLAHQAHFPYSKAYLGFGDFAPWELWVRQAYLVAGFGRAGWLDPAVLVSAALDR